MDQVGVVSGEEGEGVEAVCEWPSLVQWLCSAPSSSPSSGDVVGFPPECALSSRCSDPKCVTSEPCTLLIYFVTPILITMFLSLGVSVLCMSAHEYPLRKRRWKCLNLFVLVLGFASSVSHLALFVSSASTHAPRLLALYFATVSILLLLLLLRLHQSKLQIRCLLHLGVDLGSLFFLAVVLSLHTYLSIHFPHFHMSSFVASAAILALLFSTLLLCLAAQLWEAFARSSFANLSEEKYISDGSDLGYGEEGAGWLCYLTVGWITPMMNRGWYGRLNTVDDTFFLPKTIDIPGCADVLQQHLQRELDSCRQTIEAEIQENCASVRGQQDCEPLSPEEGTEEDDDVKLIVLAEKSPSRGGLFSGCRGGRARMPSRFSLMKVFWQVYGWSIVPQFFLKLSSDACNLASPVFLNMFITYLSEEEEEGEETGGSSFGTGVAVGLSMIVLTLLGAVFEQMYFYQSWRITFKVRGPLMINIYRKLLQVNSCELSKFSSGEIVNLMSRDAFNISYIPIYSHQFLTMPLNVIAVLCLLYWQVGISFLAGLALCVLCVPFNQWLSGRILHYDLQYYKHRDQRVKVITELLNGVRTVKLAALESFFARKVASIRNVEIFNIKRLKYLDAFCVYIWAALPVLLGVAIFTSYASLGNAVSAATVFTVLCYVNLLIGPLNSFPWVLNTLIEAYVSFKRLNRFFALKQFQSSKFYGEEKSSGQSTPTPTATPCGALFEQSSEHADWSPNAAMSAPVVVKMREAVFSYGRKLDPETSVVKSAMLKACLNVLCMAHESEESDSEANNNKGFQQLTDINLSVDSGAFVGVYGKVGAGKTSLMSAIIGEMNKVRGSVNTSETVRGFGYVPQEAWLQTGTIRDNILFGSLYDKVWYRKVLRACALVEDLDSLPDKDLTQVGERGITLSGGQKARVNLARAIYKKFDIYLLDDPMSAVDAHVAAHIYVQCIRGVLKGKTVILCTHHVQYLKEADLVLQLEKGVVVGMGSAEQVLPQSSADLNEEEEEGDTAAVKNNVGDGKEDEASRLELPEREDPEYRADELVDEDEQRVGDVDWKLYLTYLEASGKLLCIVTLLALTLMQTSKNVSDWWLTYWTDNINETTAAQSSSSTNQITYAPGGANSSVRCNNGAFIFYHINLLSVNHEDCETYQHLSLPYRVYKQAAHHHLQDYKYYLLVYGLIALSNSFFSLFRAFSFAMANIQASITIHERLLDSVMKFKSSFFSTTPVGRIVNRFSSDVTVLDDDLPFMLNILLGQSFTAIGLLTVILATVPYITPLVLCMVVGFYRLQIYYRRTSRELRRIATANMSPVYHHFNESLYGAAVIKAMRVSDVFLRENERRVVRANRGRFNERAVQRWFGIRVQLVSAVVLMLAIAVGLVQKQFFPSLIQSGLLGLCLSYCLTIRSTLTQLLATFAENEKNIISVERIADYSDDPLKFERLHGDIPKQQLVNWPNKGCIEFDNVTLRYGDDESKEPALRALSFRIEPGTKVGICGRTGAGKSSILSVLFRLEQVSGGCVRIDSVDIGAVPVRLLRSSLSIIPQDPFLFTGTVRENLDQSEEGEGKSDEQLWQALERAHMRTAVEKLGGLEAEVGEKGQYFSAGQKQLMCLARALLLQTRVLCLDEATANVDQETDSCIQHTIREQFGERTVITIAHRINTILHCDSVLVLDKGQVCEQGHPLDLIKQENSHFAHLVKQSGADTTTMLD